MPNLIAIQNPENVSKSVLRRLGGLEPVGLRLVEDFEDAEEYGSILQVSYTADELDQMEKKLVEIEQEAQYGNLLVQMETAECVRLIRPLIKQARLLAQKYDVVVTNPPYMGNKGMNTKLSKYVQTKYSIAKADMFAVFTLRNSGFSKRYGIYAMITQPSFLFLSSFSNLRESIIKHERIINLLHMGRGIFGIDFGSTAFVISKAYVSDYVGSYMKLHQRTFQYIEIDDIEAIYLRTKEDKQYKFDFSAYAPQSDLSIPNDEEQDAEIDQKPQKIFYQSNQDSFLLLPNNPIAYTSEVVARIYKNCKLFKDVAYSFQGIITGDNNYFLRMWQEVNIHHINYLEGITIYSDDGAVIFNFPKQHIANGKRKNVATNYYYKKMVRIIKKMRYLMEDMYISSAKGVSSFGLESLLWNLPDELFTKYTFYGFAFDEIVNYLNANKYMLSFYKEANGIKPLCPTSDDLSRYKKFIDDLRSFFHYEL